MTLAGVFVALVTAALAGPALCRPPPRLGSGVESPDGKFVARSDVAHERLAVYRVGAWQTPLWELEGRHPIVYLSDDPQYLVSAHEGDRQLDKDHASDEVLLRVYQKSRLIRAIRLPELIKHPERLRASDFFWAQALRFTGVHEFAVSTTENLTYTFDVTTGKLKSEEKYFAPPVIHDSP